MTRKGLLLTLLFTLLAAGQAQAVSDQPGEGWFHFECTVVRDARIDPLVFPGTVGISHEHEAVGNRSWNENSTNQGLRYHPATSCRDDREEKQNVPEAQRAYANSIWYPRFYDAGTPLTATKVTSAYSVTPIERDFASIVPFSADMNFIVGSSAGGPSTINGQSVYRILCPSGYVNFGSQTVAPLCNAANLRVELRAPDCWDGVNQSPPGFKSHMAYSSRPQGSTQYICPLSHPVLVPSHRITIQLPTDGGPDLTVASGSGASANTTGNMSTLHYDYMSADVQGARTQRTQDCLNANEYCGGTSRPVPGEGGGI